METRGMIDAFRRWLPYPVYRFVGGPFDGQDLAVTLHKMDRGMVPPEVWELIEPLPPPSYDEPIANEVTLTIHHYRFVRKALRANEGHYEWIEP